MTDARDPLRLMDAQHVDPALRAALRQVSSAQPDAAEVAALVERVGDALRGGASGASWFSQFASHGGAFKLMALLVAGGATMWGAAKTLPLEARPELAAVAAQAVERAAQQPSVDLAGGGPDGDRATAAAAAIAAEPPALPTVELARNAAPSSTPHGDAPARARSRVLAPFGHSESGPVAPRGVRVRAAAVARMHSAAPASTRTKEEAAAPAHDEALLGEESELALITRAQSALKLAPRRALELLDRHDTLYPDGHFAEEREVLWIDALSQLGMRRALTARGQRFLSSYPSSIHCARVRSLLKAVRPSR